MSTSREKKHLKGCRVSVRTLQTPRSMRGSGCLVRPMHTQRATAAMGKVVDSNLRVLGIAGLHMADGSNPPCSH